jgi:hypothetical protein
MTALRPVLVAALATVGAAAASAQQAEMEPRARCAQLLAYWDQRSASKGEGATGSDMTRKAAGLDCDNRRYGEGIKRMEDLLRQNRYPVPPPQ